MMKQVFFFAMLIAGVLALTACGGEGDSGSAESLEGSVNIDGSSTVYPVTEAVAEEFRLEEPNVKVTIGVSGTGGGFQKFCRGEIDINDASRPIKDSETESCGKEGIEYVELAVAYDGLAVVVNPENDWLENITVEELKTIWDTSAQGNIMRWNQIRPEWPDEEIHLFGPGIASGTYDYFTEAITGTSGQSRGDFTASEDDNVLVQGIAGDKYAMGFFGLAYYEENKDKLKLVGVDNGTGPVKPSLETVGDGSYAPLSRPLFIYVGKQAASRPEVDAFVNFYLDNAGFLAEDVGYIALPEDKMNETKEKYNNFAPAAEPQAE